MRALLVTAIICGVAAEASAHHAAAPVFDMNAEKTVAGVVKQVDWTNPHIWIWLDVQNAPGQTETWGFEGMSPNFLARRGWTRTSLLPGMRITVTFRPLRDGKAGGATASAPPGNGTAPRCSCTYAVRSAE